MTPEEIADTMRYYDKHMKGWGILPLWAHAILFCGGAYLFYANRFEWSGWRVWVGLAVAGYSLCEMSRRRGHREGFVDGLREFLVPPGRQDP